ncbi:MAG: LytTR family DNA-binding domain-containing protein [Coprobacillus sp.]
MKITLNEDKTLNHYEIIITVHPKNKKIAKMAASQMNNIFDEIVVFDDYRNRYPISIISIYYIEMIDHKMFVYTETEVYRLYTKLSTIKEQLASFGFYQINVRTLVNSKHIQKYTVTKECRREILMDNGEVLISNRRYRCEFDKMIKEKIVAKKIKQ